jgi:alpha-methylacyl-CoA racemase
MAGPLSGLKIVEFVGMGPAPFAAMLLADMGAEVIRIDRPAAPGAADAPDKPQSRFDVLARGRRSLALDLKKPAATRVALQLIEKADAVIEGFRPGVMERLGLGPDVCQARNRRLVYGRMTGWGQHGPLARAAGHDINYIAISGVLHAIGEAGGAPVVPGNYIGDFGGGGMLLAFGMMCAMFEARAGGRGQVVDAAMTDGAALLASMMYGFKAAGELSNARGENLLDGGAHFYRVYACADGKYVSVASIEPQFYARLLALCGIDDPAFAAQHEQRGWPALQQRLADVFRTKTRAQWCALAEGRDICFAPVLDWDEAPLHAHNVARRTFIELDGVTQPAPAPRFSRTPPGVPSAPRETGADGPDILREWGVDAETLGMLIDDEMPERRT